MDDPSILAGTWLLIDAAAPVTSIGLVANKQWKARILTEAPFLECGPPALRKILNREGVDLASLSGVIYAAGPGSTLGLRLAAMLIRTLLQLPGLSHWRCCSYNNLEIAALDKQAGGEDLQLLAPWKKNRWHRVSVSREGTNGLRLDSVETDRLDLQNVQFIVLGNRRADFPEGSLVHPYEFENIPRILSENPGLLTLSNLPNPYLAEPAKFMRWSSRRHRGSKI